MQVAEPVVNVVQDVHINIVPSVTFVVGRFVNVEVLSGVPEPGNNPTGRWSVIVPFAVFPQFVLPQTTRAMGISVGWFA